MKIWKFEITFNKDPDGPASDPLERFFNSVEELNAAWSNAVEHKCGVKPWIDWHSKEVQVVEHKPITIRKIDRIAAELIIHQFPQEVYLLP